MAKNSNLEKKCDPAKLKEMSEFLFKDLPFKIQTTKLSERRQVFEDIKLYLQNQKTPEKEKEGVPEGIIRGLCKIATIVLPQYVNNRSRSLLNSLVTELLELYPGPTCKYLTAAISDYAKQIRNYVPSRQSAEEASFVLLWTTKILRKRNISDDILKPLIEAQGIMFLHVKSTNMEKSRIKMYKRLEEALIANPEVAEKLLSICIVLEASPVSLSSGTIYYTYFAGRKQFDKVEKLKAFLIETFVKAVITTKTKPPEHVLQVASEFLKYLSHDEFKKSVLPALQKAILRNPEMIMEAFSFVLGAVSIDLSQYAAEIGKAITGPIHAKDDKIRESSIKAIETTARQCSDVAAIKSLVNILFGILGGSEGKLTLALEKISVIQGIGKLSHHGVSGSSVHDLSVNVANQFIKILTTEVHEGTLIEALNALSNWTARFSDLIPNSLIETFKKGVAMKTATAPVRTAYFICMEKSFHGNGLVQGGEVVATLLKGIERAAAQPGQVPVVTEGVVSAYLLLKLAATDPKVESQAGALWPLIADPEKCVFFAEKFLSSATEEGIHYTSKMVESLLHQHLTKVTKNHHVLYHTLVVCLTRHSYSVRSKVATSIKRIVSKMDGAEDAKNLLKALKKFLEQAKIVVGEKEHESTSQPWNEVKGHSLVYALENICSASFSESEDELLKNLFFIAYHPAIFKQSTNIYGRILKKWLINPEKVVERMYDTFYADIISAPFPNEWNACVLVNLSEYEPGRTCANVVNLVAENLSIPELLTVTRDDFFIFKTQEGELYDRSVIESHKEEATKNIKRESKAYSYKEQMEEIQLRRELEEKRRKEGKIKQPEYTPKQKEAMKMQLAKESEIRSRVKKLFDKIESTLSILRCCLLGAPGDLSCHFKRLLPILLKTLKSPIAAPQIMEVYSDLRKCVFHRDYDVLGLSVGKLTLRLNEPQCDLDPAWEGELLQKATLRVIFLLVESMSDKPYLLFQEAQFFVYNLQFLFAAFKKFISVDQILEGGIKFIQLMTAKLSDCEEVKHLALGPLMDTLIWIIEKQKGRMQQSASVAFLDVCSLSVREQNVEKSIAGEDEVNVLLSALESETVAVRDAGIRGLVKLLPVLKSNKISESLQSRILRRFWVAKHDQEATIRGTADQLWKEAKLSVRKELSHWLLNDVTHPVEPIRSAGADAMAAALQISETPLKDVIEMLLQIYAEKLTMKPPVLDQLGRVVEEAIDFWEPRSGIAVTLSKLAPLLDQDDVIRLANFFVPGGLLDRNEVVRKNMLAASVALIDIHGKDTVSDLLPVFEKFLDEAPKSSQFDKVRQSVVILMGGLARHLDKSDKKIKPIIGKLISALKTPSQQVQEAVANCLPPLVPAIKDSAGSIVDKLLTQLLESDNYGDRKGASYGLAGVVKGLGILSLKQLEIMSKLTEAIQDKKNFKRREGALMAFEQLCNMLGRLFEPYVVHVLPHLLLCFGDSNQYVREATDETAKAVMSRLSAHGVKLVLPSLLAALEEDSWRTKAGSVELLGAMAYCAPKQLSSCLPNIVPKLIEVLGDSHIKVQQAGGQALEVIGSVIKNPEIQAIVPVLLGALQDPSKKTSSCLATLLDTKFVHFIDAPSLALIMPVVQRAFQDRSTETRKMAAQIIGNMYSLTDQKDLSPYLPTIIPGLKASVVDPVPEVRTVSARALGAMVRGMGEASFDDLLPWLMQTLTSEASPVDRSGAAQGLAEVVGGLGIEKLHKLMPEIIATAERLDIAPHVKDGYILLFIYMPAVFQSEFIPYISQIIPPILKALADENEFVRDTALKAGQRIVNMYADNAITLLLPELEKGLFNENWRIRYSSVQLLGDLLFKISGVSGKMTTETAHDDDNFGTETSQKVILETLGSDRRNRVLSGLYMGRSDVALMVRQAALHVWKVVVSNTPRTLREILPVLFELLLGCLASTSHDKRQVAARTLGDLVKKLGERVLPEIIPILEKGLEADRSDQRQGVCVGLSEIMGATSREMVLTFVDNLVPTVRKALIDPLPEVRSAAAKTFDSLHSTVGSRALDDILPYMLEQLNDPVLSDFALDGLRQVMAVKSRAVLPYLIPQLTAPPVNTRALAVLASVAGEALSRHLTRILPALLQALSDSFGKPMENKVRDHCESVVLAVSDGQGIRTIMDELLAASRPGKGALRRSAVVLLASFCARTKSDYSEYINQLFRGLITLMTEPDDNLINPAWDGLQAVIQSLDPPSQVNHVSDLRQAVRFASSDVRAHEGLMPGFCLQRGVAPLLPIYREAILSGSPEVKEQASNGLTELIKLTSAEGLKSSVMQITGPLIRILGDRYSYTVKTAVLETLSLLLAKVGVQLKPFLPQLQTTFLKALQDPQRQVRMKAATGLSHLVVIHHRPDPMFTELHNGIKSQEDPSVKETWLQALRGVCTPAGDKMNDTLRKSVLQTLLSSLSSPEEGIRTSAAGCIGALCRWVGTDELHMVIADNLLDDDPMGDWTLRHGKSMALFVALKEAAPNVYAEEWKEKIQKLLLSYLAADRIPIVISGIRATGYLFRYHLVESKPMPVSLIQPFAKSLNKDNNDIKQLVAQVSNFLAKSVKTPLPTELLKPLLPMLVNGTKEKNTAVKAHCELALVNVLHLRVGDDTHQKCLQVLDAGAREALNEVIVKTLKKVATQPEGKEEELDATLLI
ncbi:stalled ribosome sensor GCN1-like [Artemia franciscana]|uniref:stalled ribosome sensor GCN1-like n=1 Tax=Artemia franciscana TaxID=6661 RepID=UPI0032DA27AA